MERKYIELVIAGPFAIVKAWITGYLQGLGIEEGFYFSRDCHIRRETLAERVMEWAGLHTSHTFLIIWEELLEKVEHAISSHREDMKFTVEAKNQVESASFKFYYHAFTKKDGEELKNYFETLPKALELKDYMPDEIIYEDAKGAEGYAPLHSYEIKAHGVIEGPFIEVLNAHRDAGEFALTSLEEIRLKLTEIK